MYDKQSLKHGDGAYVEKGGEKMAKATKTRKIGRDAETGKFIPVSKAKRNPKTTVVETIKIKKK